MKFLSTAALLALTLFLGACASGALNNTAHQQPVQDLDWPSSTNLPRETVLLVSLEDGSVIKQTIFSGADLCFKKNSDTSTTCLTQGAPVIDPDTNAVIGFEMIEDHIELVAKSD